MWVQSYLDNFIDCLKVVSLCGVADFQMQSDDIENIIISVLYGNKTEKKIF